ncbi:hypothetical protein OEZ60_20775 [Defluviimonas sp. WL0024]|uniref:Uncharacterized protein n=1 Tax=Albidovulum salinarum TaxID=2984153 RepID=A0ABT2X8Z4_9RHOB|nr:hypothetical protein [Defluviimonas sp. WL0024]MCU9850422.1 hypothetical protein [Defluviimonas sp. WL0024]
MNKLAVACAAALFGTAATAQDSAQFTYEMFETAVGHVNLAECPAALAGEGRFCRVTMHNDAFHVFAFSEAGEQPMVGLKTWFEDELEVVFK